MLQIVKPNEIEKKSFEIITEELNGRTFAPEIEPIVKRVIHTSADFDYADHLVFTDGAVQCGLKALKHGAHIVTDTTMAMSGINKRALAELGGEVHCFIGDEDVIQQAKARGITRAMVCMEKASQLQVPLIVAVGNAPTALIHLCELMDQHKLSPELVIGVPVGFVNVVESKELLLEQQQPAIVARGRKGGSNIAAAIVNALLYQVRQREGF